MFPLYLTLVNASLPNGTVDGGSLTLTGASRITASSISLAHGGQLTLDGPRVIASGPWTTDANSDNPYHAQLKGPGKTLVKTMTDASLLTVKNGATFYFGTTSNDFAIPDTLVEDGGSYAVCEAGRMQGTATDVRAITLNGGSIDLTSQFSGAFAYASKANTMKICIGEKGGTIGSTSSRTGRYVSSDNINLNVAVEDATPADADGGTFRIDCGMPLTPTAKWSLKGPLALADAFVNVNRASYDLYEDGKLFGSGDLVMESGAWLGFAQTTDAITPHVAWGEGRKLRVTGAARLNISPLVSTAWKDRTGDLTLTVGPSDATESSLVVEPGAALMLWNSENLKGMPSTFHVRVNGGVACHADGRTKAALVFQGNNYTDFLTYDANLGLTNFNNYVNGFAGGADSTVLVNVGDRFTLEAGETAIGAIKVAVNDSNTKNVKIPAGATLKIGNGTDPAVVLFQTTGSSKTYVPFDGAGSIDFGTSKGVFFYPRKNNVYYVQPVHLRTRLTGKNGVNYLCANGNDSGDSSAPNASFSVDVANDYEGDTVIDMASVIATDKDAFSSGDVVVRGSRLVGGAAVFGCEGPFANNFTISKFGRRLTLGYIPKGGGDRVYYPSSLGWGTLSCGALEFAVAGTRITGDVHVVGRSRISSYFPADGSEVAIFEGVVSGDTLEIVDSFPKDNGDGLVGRRHKFVFCNANSITGGVEVLNCATAVLRGASRRTAIQYTGGLGTYTNSLFGVEFGPFNGAAAASSRAASGGGGASKNGTQNTSSANRGKGGEGLASDITGELLVYGAGGGGGGGANLGSSVFYQGGLGGSRAGNGGYYAAEDGGYSSSVADITKANYAERAVAATDAEANSGGGGGGALGIKDASRNGEGADGIVVIRYEVFESPCDGGDIITKTLKHGSTYTWVHQFTNTAKAAEFINRTGRDLKLRYLVVGAGGPGGNTYSGGSFYSGGGGGGGGGVCERKDIAFASDASWQVVVGKGGIIQTQPIGGTSAISNGVADVETVPGGGGGARGNAVSAKDGASGGGGSVSAKTAGKGTYTNSLFGVEYGPFNGGAGSSTAGNGGGGGGAGAAGSGAGSAATSADGGEGLSSDITGESLIYGSGGGGGWGCKRTPISNYRRGGLGGGRAGNGATYEIIDDGVTTNYFAATCAALNSGGGGGGGPGRDPASVGNQPTPGADGVVIFRYDFNENPQGLMLIVR